MQIIIFFIFIFFSSMTYSGQLDIDDIKSKCLTKHSSTASKQYVKCVNNSVSKKLTIKNNNKNTNNKL